MIKWLSAYSLIAGICISCASPPAGELPQHLPTAAPAHNSAKFELPGEEFYSDFSGALEWENRRSHQTPHYTIISNLSKSAARRYGQILEAFHEKWSRCVIKPELDHRLLVRIYSNQAEFMKREKKSQAVGGFYGGGCVVTYHGRFGPTDYTHNVLFNQCNLQILDFLIGMKKTPAWFAQGLGRFFAYLVCDSNNALQPTFRANGLARVQNSIREDLYIPLSQLLEAPLARFSAAYYDYAHLLVYYLAKTTARNRKIFDRYCKALLHANADEKISSVVLIGGQENLNKLEKHWHGWILSLSASDTPRQAWRKALEQHTPDGR